MDETATPEQRALLDASGRFAEATYPLRSVREDAFADANLAADYWQRAADLGWFSMLVPEHLGGGCICGNGVLDAALIAYGRGRRLQPGPFVGTNIVALALADAGSDEQRNKVLPQLVAGEQSAVWIPSTPGLGGMITASRCGSDYELSGSMRLVADAEHAAWLLVTASTDFGLAQFLLPASRPGVTVVPLASLDLSRRMCEVRFDSAVVRELELVGRPESTDELVSRLLAIGAVLTAAEAVGAMDADFARALQYSKDRIAFGRPIGSFQAIKHLLADTSMYLEMSKATVLAAATALGAGDDDAVQVASMAKAFVGEYSIDLAQNCFQVFGGIGFTWEHDQHLYLRRITSDAALFGDAAWHRERICALSGLNTGEGA